jgi:hypothetical protein
MIQVTAGLAVVLRVEKESRNVFLAGARFFSELIGITVCGWTRFVGNVPWRSRHGKDI